jgi:hypothetical protein
MITISGITRQYQLANSYLQKNSTAAASDSSSSSSATDLATKMASLGAKLEEVRSSAASSTDSSASSSSTGESAESTSSSTALSEHESAMSEAIDLIKQNIEARLSSAEESPTYSRPVVKTSDSSSSSSASEVLDAVTKKGQRDQMNAKVLGTIHASGVGTISGSYTVTVDPTSSTASVEASGDGSSDEQAQAIEDAINNSGLADSLYSHIASSAEGQDNAQLEDAEEGETALSITLSSDGLHDIGQENGYGYGDTAWIDKLQAGL